MSTQHNLALGGMEHLQGKNKPVTIPGINLLSPYSDQHQFSPDNIHVLPREMVMRGNEMITKVKMLDLLTNSLN